LHHSIRTILDQVEVQATARKLVLARSLDERIDAVPLSLEHKLEEPEGLWVLGSELRLHQVLTNLAANAVKFSPEAGGSIRISTEFLGISTRDELPGNPPDIDQDPDQSVGKSDFTRIEATSEPFDNGPETSPTPMKAGSGSSVGAKTQCLNFRLVVHDTGPGIKPSDLVEGRLFQPFAQVISHT
jgi:signal transduction histidine kinase